jgi:hypothetical protein
LAPRLREGKREKVQDEVEKASARKVVKNFHYSRLRRRQDLERRRREKTIKWMQALYGISGYMEPALAPEQKRDQLQDIVATEGGAPLAELTDDPIDRVAGNQEAASVAATPSVPVPRPPLEPAPSTRAPRPRPRLAGSGRQESTASPDLRHSALDAASTAAGAGPDGRSQLQTRPVRNVAFVAPSMPGAAAAAAMVDDTDPIDDEELLEWSKHLNFDAYMAVWQRTATTDGSEGVLPIAARTAAGAPVLPVAPAAYAVYAGALQSTMA